jgi:hypothetical protein
MDEVFRVIVAGSRTFYDYDFLRARLDRILSNIKIPIEIVSGGAKGADELGERYAEERGYRVKRFPAQWTKHGRGAGPIRNEEMATYVSPDGACVAFWDGISRGTKDMIDRATRHNLKLRVVIYE